MAITYNTISPDCDGCHGESSRLTSFLGTDNRSARPLLRVFQHGREAHDLALREFASVVAAGEERMKAEG